MDSLANIHGVNNSKAPAEQKTQPHRKHATAFEPRQADSVEISPRASELTNLNDARLLRTQRVDRVRDQIEDGTYVTEHKINATVEKLFAKLSALDLLA